MRQGVHGVGGYLRRWAGGQQVRIEQGVFRHQQFVAEGFLETVRAAHAQHGVLGGFAAGAGGGGYGDERHGGTVIGFFRSDSFQIIHDGIAARQQAGDRLGGVQHAATADAGNRHGARAVELPNHCVHELRRGFVLDLHLFPADAGFIQRCP